MAATSPRVVGRIWITGPMLASHATGIDDLGRRATSTPASGAAEPSGPTFGVRRRCAGESVALASPEPGKAPGDDRVGADETNVNQPGASAPSCSGRSFSSRRWRLRLSPLGCSGQRLGVLPFSCAPDCRSSYQRALDWCEQPDETPTVAGRAAHTGSHHALDIGRADRRDRSSTRSNFRCTFTTGR